MDREYINTYVNSLKSSSKDMKLIALSSSFQKSDIWNRFCDFTLKKIIFRNTSLNNQLFYEAICLLLKKKNQISYTDLNLLSLGFLSEKQAEHIQKRYTIIFL